MGRGDTSPQLLTMRLQRTRVKYAILNDRILMCRLWPLPGCR
jgi:hypothetical protein